MTEAINIIGRGVNDPHIHIFNDRAYLYASHDHSADNTKFVMKDWWVWSSDDLLTWTHETTVRPEDIYIGKPIDGCWATDAVEKDGRFYWALSEVTPERKQIPLVVSDRPGGPFCDELGGPLLAHGCVDTTVYDPAFFKEDDGSVYILFGVWNYYMAKMADDMRSTSEPFPITVINPEGPYGKGKTDDKVSVHKCNGLYYLSWGAYYATAETLTGPYMYRGCIVGPDRMEARFCERTWPHGPTQGRHGNLFQWKGQWYFTYCEMCFSNNRFFRDFWISPVFYRADGSIEPIVISSDAARLPTASKAPTD